MTATMNAVTEQQALGPCPHCGNERTGLTAIRDGYEAWCKCGAAMRAYNPDSRAKAIDRWNARALATEAAQPEGVVPGGEPIAWAFELATTIHSDGTYSSWDEKPRLSLTKPCVPEGSIRNLRPLFAASPTPPAPLRADAGNGWVFWNPDSGEEYAPDHPIMSGECVEAERIRPSTPQEDTLWAAFQEQFTRAEALTTPKPEASQGEEPAEAEVERLHEAASLIAGVLFADPGPKEKAARDAARKWWHEYDAALSTKGEG